MNVDKIWNCRGLSLKLNLNSKLIKNVVNLKNIMDFVMLVVFVFFFFFFFVLRSKSIKKHLIAKNIFNKKILYFKI